MPEEAPIAIADNGINRLRLRVAWLCGLVLMLEGYDIAAVGYAIPSLVDAWHLRPSKFTPVLTAGNVGLLLGSLSAGLLGDWLGRKRVLIGCVAMFGVFSLLSALAASPSQLAGLRLLTGLGLGGGLPLAIALASDVAPRMTQGRFVILTSTGVPIGLAVGGLLASRLVGPFGWPAIFCVGGVLPLAIVPLLALRLPASGGPHAEARPRNLVAALFQNGIAPTTLLLWSINLLSLFGIYFILLWMPAILHSAGMSPSRAVFSSTMYSVGIIAGPVLVAPVVDRVGIERVLTCGLAFGALCVLSIGLFSPPLWLLTVLIGGAGIGGGCQSGINSLAGLAYPRAIRSTGAGWALGAGRIGSIAGPLLGGALLGLGFRTRELFVAAAVPAFGVTLLMAILGRLRRSSRR